ncbi:putative 4-coumarate--CoA ligase 3 [Haematobia irritans]|uniref:putative 4-coumarate--CoA ligase 3 n=1 Tax=Haematobia irritans TaxID=7368 RepID=UPI003F4F6CE5
MMDVASLTATFYDADQRIWYGPRREDSYSSDKTLGEVIYDALKRNPKKVIQIHDVTGEKLTCEELLTSAEALSRNLLKLGLKVGDVIGLYAHNWTHVTTVMLASFLCGTPVNALYPGFDKESVYFMYSLTMPKVIFCEMENHEIAVEIKQKMNLEVPIYLVNGHGSIGEVRHISELLTVDNLETASEFRYPCHDLHGDATAMILCSSGTTGTPKAVCCSNRALLNQNVFLTLTSESIACTFSTMYWASGLWTLVASLTTGCLRIVTNHPFTCDYFLELVRRHKITHFLTATFQMAQLYKYENINKIQTSLESIDTLLSGGSKVLVDIQKKLNEILSCNPKRLGFTVCYSMSELSSMLSYNGGYLIERLEGSEGKLASNKMVRIIDENGDPLGPNEHGEICISTPYKWSGYLKNEEATHKAMRNNWLYTGDIGYFDTEGFLHVCARDNDVFRSRGFQIYPQFIEEIVCRLPGVEESCVVGIPDFLDSNLTACAVVRSRNESGANLIADDIAEHVKTHMGSMYHLNGGVYFLEAMPKTTSGKVQRRNVLDQIMEMKEGKQYAKK